MTPESSYGYPTIKNDVHMFGSPDCSSGGSGEKAPTDDLLLPLGLSERYISNQKGGDEIQWR